MAALSEVLEGSVSCVCGSERKPLGERCPDCGRGGAGIDAWLVADPAGRLFGTDRSIESVRFTAPVVKRSLLTRLHDGLRAFVHGWKWGQG